METTTTAKSARPSRRRLVATPDRPDIRVASVVVVGAYSERHASRGVEIVATVLFHDGESRTLVWDFLPGPDRYGDLGGWDPADPRMGRWLDNAAEWLRGELVPPCSPIAS